MLTWCREDLTPVWWGQRVSTAEKEHEVDVLVAMPGAGIVAIELKARS
ncbi:MULTISPECIES: hypothetical protein [unclassified Dietzia]|nr:MULTISPECIES: hypothetical protein [unclassified Dietzia]MBB1024459.1 hypothetical protein [Dietzia sp. DQ12-76]MBB1026360.1 hypothetical protein [Dietzia sp. DQ11-38-2]QGW24446.1 hypothetical protein GJR88_02178 [Dietzia sp. DQ12-45-1b]